MRKRLDIHRKEDKSSMISDKYDQDINYPSSLERCEISQLTDCQ